MSISPELTAALLEKKRRADHLDQYQPLELENWNQVRLHKSGSSILLCFGGNQSGKSMFSANEIIWWLRQKHPYKSTPGEPITAWVISTEYVTIQNGVYRHIRNCIPDWELSDKGPKVQGHDMHSYFKMKNGSIVRFMSAKGGDETREKFQADRVHVIAIDEEIPETLWEELRMRQVATPQSIVIISATLVKSEPWILNLESKAERGDTSICMTRLDTRKNPAVNQEKLAEVMSTMDEETIKYRIEGRSRKFRGLVYSNWSRRTHCIAVNDNGGNWTPPKDACIYCALDPGLRTFAGAWVAVMPNGHKVMYDEMYFSPEALYEVADLIRVKEGWKFTGEFLSLSNGVQIKQWCPDGDRFRHVFMRIIDDKFNSRTITGEMGVLETLSNLYGIMATPALKDKQAGIERCRQALRVTPQGKPEFQVTSNCTNFIKEIEGYRYHQDDSKFSRNSRKDEPIKRDDHLMDCWRYLMNSGLNYFPPKDFPDMQGFNETFKQGTDWDIIAWRKKKMRRREEGGRSVHDVCGIY